jgi:hypothetical protein
MAGGCDEQHPGLITALRLQLRGAVVTGSSLQAGNVDKAADLCMHLLLRCAGTCLQQVHAPQAAIWLRKQCMAQCSLLLVIAPRDETHRSEAGSMQGNSCTVGDGVAGLVGACPAAWLWRQRHGWLLLVPCCAQSCTQLHSSTYFVQPATWPGCPTICWKAPASGSCMHSHHLVCSWVREDHPTFVCWYGGQCFGHAYGLTALSTVTVL